MNPFIVVKNGEVVASYTTYLGAIAQAREEATDRDAVHVFQMLAELRTEVTVKLHETKVEQVKR